MTMSSGNNSTYTSTTLPIENTINPITSALLSRINKKQLQRASSAPTHGPNPNLHEVLSPRYHEITLSQKPILHEKSIKTSTTNKG
jgi:hypothetical protein